MIPNPFNILPEPVVGESHGILENFLWYPGRALSYHIVSDSSYCTIFVEAGYHYGSLAFEKIASSVDFLFQRETMEQNHVNRGPT